MTSLTKVFSASRDSVFFGQTNCFRLALQDPQSEESGPWAEAFQLARLEDINALLETRAGSGWSRQRLVSNEQVRFDAAIRGLCLATAGLLQRSASLLADAVQTLAGLSVVNEQTPVPPAAAHQQEIEDIRRSLSSTDSDIDELLARFTRSESADMVAAALIVRDLHACGNSAHTTPATAVCHCPVAYAWGAGQASILRLIVRCLPSEHALITPDLSHGGALLWSVYQTPGNLQITPGWQAVTDVWKHLQPLCPGVRVAIGIEEWDSNQELQTPILEGDSIQAATAVAIWHAWHQTTLAAAQRSELEKIDPRLLDFELDPSSLVTAALDLNHSSPTEWRLKWVDSVGAKFRAAHKCGLKLGHTAQTRSPESDTELNSQPLPYSHADTFPELCDSMAIASAQLREYQQRNIDDWYSEFLNEAEAEALVAEREREHEQAEQAS
jgi:hypothetical protein